MLELLTKRSSESQESPKRQCLQTECWLDSAEPVGSVNPPYLINQHQLGYAAFSVGAALWSSAIESYHLPRVPLAFYVLVCVVCLAVSSTLTMPTEMKIPGPRFEGICRVRPRETICITKSCPAFVFPQMRCKDMLILRYLQIMLTSLNRYFRSLLNVVCKTFCINII